MRPDGGVTTSLLLSVSGVDDHTVDGCAVFAADAAALGVPLSLLVAPRPPRGRGLRRSAEWLRSQRAAGSAVVLHGYDHVPPPGHGRRAEFGTLPAHEAGLRLAAGVAVLERLGLPTDVFAPPRWRASPGTLEALRRRGFAICATAVAVHDLQLGVARPGRVLGIDRDGMVAPWWWPDRWRGVARLARRPGMLRLAVEADAVAVPSLRRAILSALEVALDNGATPTIYAAAPTARRLVS